MYWRIIKTCNSYELQVLYKSSGVVLPSAYFRWCWHKLLRPCKITEAFVWLLKLSKKQLDVIRQWVQHYSKSVRENTTRNFSAKDKPGTLPLNLFESAPPEQHSVDFDVLLNEDIPVQHQDTSTACNIVIAQSRYVVVSRIYKPCSAPNSPLYITKLLEDVIGDYDSAKYYLLLALVNGSTDTTSPNEADEEPFAESVDGQGDEDSITMGAGQPQRKRKRTVNQEFLFY